MQVHKHLLLSPAPGTQRELVSLHYGRPGSGPKVYIQASLHADELPGMLTAHHLRQQLDRLEAEGRIQGEIVLVPMANPIGLSQWLAGNPPDVIATNLGLDAESTKQFLARLPRREVFIAPPGGPVAPATPAP